MTTRMIRIGGLQASLFASQQRGGFELSYRYRNNAQGFEELLPDPLPLPEAAASLAERIAAHSWYHSVELAPGQVTPGFFDHRPLLPLYQLPARLDGQRVLDIATFDGFWAFEFEKRGAAEVIALDVPTLGDIDLPPRRRAEMAPAKLAEPMGAGFELAREALGSSVRRERCNVYDLTPERFGLFDTTHLGDVLLHLRDPLKALWNMRQVTRGTAYISDCFNPDLDRHGEVALMEYRRGAGHNVWWRFGANTLRAMIEDAGFSSVEEVARFRYGPRGQPQTMWHIVFRAIV
jgi:tRNA (mo5U34)-methyltransferase